MTNKHSLDVLYDDLMKTEVTTDVDRYTRLRRISKVISEALNPFKGEDGEALSPLKGEDGEALSPFKGEDGEA